MANGINKCDFIGYIGSDPETRQAGNNSVTTISLGVGESWKDKNTGEKKENTEWIRIQFWGRLGEIVAQYCTKGTQIYASGSMKTTKYDKNGETRYSTEIVGREMRLLGGKGQAQSNSQSHSPAPAMAVAGVIDDSGDIPF